MARESIDGSSTSTMRWMLVDVVALDGIVHDAHSEAQLDLAQRVLDGASAAERAQKARTGQQSHRYVDRVPRFELFPPHMRYARLCAIRLAASTLPFATSPRQLHLHLFHEIDYALICLGIASVA